MKNDQWIVILGFIVFVVGVTASLALWVWPWALFGCAGFVIAVAVAAGINPGPPKS